MEQEITAIQPQLTQHFAKLINENHLAHAYLLSGASGTGKLSLAVWIAQGIFCNQRNADGTPCLKCSECRRIAANEHPDVVRIIPEGRSIKVDQVRYLKSEFSKSGLEGNRKVFIIQDVEKMTTSAANSLLKFIEEPNGSITAFLLSSHANQILPTIVSRCQVVEMASLNRENQLKKLMDAGVDKAVGSVLVNLNADFDELVALGTDEQFQKLLTEVVNWMKAILADDWRAFVYVQTRLMPLVDERPAQERLLELMVMICRDLILLRYHQDDEVAFITEKQMLTQAAAQIPASQLTKGVELVMNCWNQLAVNVSYQNVLEGLTLRLCRCYHKR